VCLKLRLQFTEKGKIGWASCCETWQKFKVEVFRCSEKKMFGSWVTPLVGRHVEINLKLIHMASGFKTHTFGRHVVNEPKVGCYDVNKL
jgi:hypothetical protein